MSEDDDQECGCGPVELDSRPCRALTTREVANLLGSLIGGMAYATDPQVLRDAVRWWAESEEAWASVVAMRMMRPT